MKTPPVIRQRRRWDDIIRAIRVHGISQCEIARRVGTDQSTISKYARRVYDEPTYSVGEALLTLLEELQNGQHVD